MAGKLDLTTGGPDLDQNSGLTVFRRSIYFRHAHEKQMEMLKLFDAAGTSECYQRRESIVPQQALALANSPLGAETANAVAKQLSDEKDDDRFAATAFGKVLGRPATADELAEWVAFLRAGNTLPAQEKPLAPQDADKTDNTAYELGTQFKVNADVSATAVRFLKSPSEKGGHLGRLWDDGGKQLAEVQIVQGIGDRRTGTLKTPIVLKAGRTYLVSVNCNSHYPFARATDLPLPKDGPIAAVGGRFGPPGKLPTNDFGGVYFIHVAANTANVNAINLFAPAATPTASRRAGLVLVLFNHHEFVTVR